MQKIQPILEKRGLLSLYYNLDERLKNLKNYFTNGVSLSVLAKNLYSRIPFIGEEPMSYPDEFEFSIIEPNILNDVSYWDSYGKKREVKRGAKYKEKEAEAEEKALRQLTHLIPIPEFNLDDY